MFNTIYRFSFLLLLCLLFQHCAQMSPLTGGKRDTTAPVLLSASPVNLTTHFRSKTIVFTFNEYVQVKDLSNQLLISPKLKNNPEVQADGKKVKVLLDTSEFKPNTTYRFYFGQAISDMNEGNPVKNFEYIFSTGGHIDSMKVKGNVIDAATNAPLNNILVGIYYPLKQNDSLPFLIQPAYITHSDPSGAFMINHLSPGNFQCYAIDDINKNLVYDQEGERVGFLDSAVSLPQDSVLSFKLFRQGASKTYVKKTETPYYGFVRLLLSKRSKVTLEALYPEQSKDLFIQNQNGMDTDTLLVFYRNLEDSLKLHVYFKEEKRSDTLHVVLPKRSLKKKKFGFIQLNTSGNSLALNAALQLKFINWMDTTFIQEKSIHLICSNDTSFRFNPLLLHWSNVHELQLNTRLTEGKSFKLRIDTSAFRDVLGNLNDSCDFQFTQQGIKDLGKVTLNLNMNKKQAYLIQLLNDKDQVVKEQTVFLSLSSSNSKSLVFTEVPPGTYKVRCVFDTNENGLWDGGNLIKKIQPENVFIYPKPLKVIADWEIEEEIDLFDPG